MDNYESVDAFSRHLYEQGYFNSRPRFACQAVTYRGEKLIYPFLFEEWLKYSFELWDLLHKVADNSYIPKWDDLAFRHEDDYFCNSFATALPIWLMAINKLHSEKIRYQAYTRIFSGCDLFETMDLIDPKTPRKNNAHTNVCTVRILHEENNNLLEKLGPNSTKICGVPIYKYARSPRLSKNGNAEVAIFRNSNSVVEHAEFISENIIKWCRSGACTCVGKINSNADKKLQESSNFLSASIFVVVTSKPRLIYNGHPLKSTERFKKSCVLDAVPS